MNVQETPADYILGETEFMGIPFSVDARVLVPRPETELLVEMGLGILKNGKPPQYFGEPPKPPHLYPPPRRGEENIKYLLPTEGEGQRPSPGTREAGGRGSGWRSAERKPGEGDTNHLVLDVGTGSGCIAISLALFEPRARVTATDASEEALDVARENARRHHVSERIALRRGDLFEALESSSVRQFDLILSNPPYVSTEEWPTLPPEVLQEPRVALDGGSKGLEILRRLIIGAPKHLMPGGWLALEVGYDQSHAVAISLKMAGFDKITILKDFAGINRIVAGHQHG